VARHRFDKLLSGICDSPKNVRLSDACKAAEKLGFNAKGQSGSHHAFSKTGEMMLLNFQDTGGGKIPPYQAKQLIRMIEKHWDFERDCLRADAHPDLEAKQ
jgi:predicted RNA binding protein YcfA (HicA-like mRNA interferase family)